MSKTNSINRALAKSPINYFSDLFVVGMVAGWIVTLAVMVIMAIYSTIGLKDNTLWTEVKDVAVTPLSVGGAIWMVKNSVQHAIANSKGKEAPMDFPKVNANGEDDGAEEIYQTNKEDVL